MSDIRKWFMKQHDKGNQNASGSNKPKLEIPPKPTPPEPQSEPASDAQDGARRRKTSKYFTASASEPTTKQKPKQEAKIETTPSKRKLQKVKDDSDYEEEDDNDDFVSPIANKKSSVAKPTKKPKLEISLDDQDDSNDTKVKSSAKPAGRGRGGGRGSGAPPTAGRGRGGGRGGYNYMERKDPPHKGEKEVPEGASDCLAGFTFVISGTLDSLEREEAEDLIKRHGGRVTGSVSKKTNFLLADEDIGGRKSEKAKELGTSFLTEDGLFDMICKSKSTKVNISGVTDKKSSENLAKPSKSPMKNDKKGVQMNSVSTAKDSPKKLPGSISNISQSKKKKETGYGISMTWTEKYKPKVPNEIIGNQSIVRQLHEWLVHWNEQFLHPRQNEKGLRKTDSGAKKSLLLSGAPGIGKTTSAKLVSQMLGFQVIEVNASDSRGKADSKITRGIAGSTSNSVKELISNEALVLTKDGSKHPKMVLIMDEVDGMSAGDRGGISDLIASIKISKIPIICICNDRYSQKLKSLINHCLPLNYRKPTKQQMAKRLLQIASAEGIQANEIAMEELADRVNGDMRMAINHLQYMSLSKSVIKFDDIRERLLNSSKDEDISPFTAVDKLFGYNGGKLRMDERVDFCMADPDLVPLIIQENYLNYQPLSDGKSDIGTRRMNLIARAAESIADGDIVNVKIRRYSQWQLSQMGSLASCIIPASLLHGSRQTFEQGERNFNRFGGWLGKNSTMGKNSRLLHDLHVHVLASQGSNLDRVSLRTDYLPLLLKKLTVPLRTLSKESAVQMVVEFMDAYSLSQEDFDTIVDLSKFHGHPNPLEGVPSAVKAALTKAYKQGSNSRLVRAGAADLINLQGFKKAPKKRIAAILDPVETNSPDENDIALLEKEDDEDNSETEESDGESKLLLDSQSNSSKGIQVQLELKNSGTSNSKGARNSTVKKTPATSRSRKAPSVGEKGGRGSGSGTKRKR